MKTPREERLEAFRREMAEQNQAWQRTRAALLRLGSVELAVPSRMMAQLVGPEPAPAAPVAGMRA
jgi:hypothetical protein